MPTTKKTGVCLMTDSVLISLSAPPEDSIFYIACCAMEILRQGDDIELDELYSQLKHKYNQTLEYVAVSLALSFLYLIESVELRDGKIKKCI